MKISQADVLQFKQKYSDENSIVADIIQHRLYEHFQETIVDVGAGTGDITSLALASKQVVQIDLLDYSEKPRSQLHYRLVSDFFDYVPEPFEEIGTLFLSHVLQFLDRDLVALNDKVQALSPKKIITVTNNNDAFMGELLAWVKENFASANPEIDLSDFPYAYRLTDEVPFKGRVACTDYRLLGKQVHYLMDCEPSISEGEALENFLREKLPHPTFSINQKIKVYTRT